MSNQNWNGPRPAGRGPRVGLIVGGAVVLAALIALAVFLATRGGPTADPTPTPTRTTSSTATGAVSPTPTESGVSPTPTEPGVSPTPTEPGGSASPGEGGWPELTADVLPATVGDWTLEAGGGGVGFYGRAGDAIYPASAGSNHPVASFADFLDSPAFSSGDRVVCGTDSDSAPTCYIQTRDLGVVLVSDPAALVTVGDLVTFADAFAAQMG